MNGQQRQVLDLIGEGLTNREIGKQLFLVEKTVKNYVSSIFVKLGGTFVLIMGDHRGCPTVDGHGDHYEVARVRRN